MSISFDRAADYYDQTRAMPPEVADKVTQSIIDLAHATRDSRLLEIGIGTGRIALPLLARGYRVTGIDLSRLMMEQLVKNADELSLRAARAKQSHSATEKTDSSLKTRLVTTNPRVALAQADMARVPFASNSFDAVMAVHVLHLSPAWREAANEARRVLKKGAPFMASWHHRETISPNRILRDKLGEFAKEEGVSNKRPGAASNEEIRAELEKWGTLIELVDVIKWEERTTVGTILDEIDRQIYSDTWLIPRPVLDKILPRLREFAQVEFGGMEHEVVEPAVFTWIVARS